MSDCKTPKNRKGWENKDIILVKSMTEWKGKSENRSLRILTAFKQDFQNPASDN
jgi:hypothetical protein